MANEWRRPDSNRRPTACKAVALPTELRPPRRQITPTLRQVSENTAFNHVGQCVTDLARARRFYEELFGFRCERTIEPPDDPSATLLQLKAPLGMKAAYLRRDGLV